MKANYLIESVFTQSSTIRRTGKSFLVKPAYKASSFMCTEYNFDKTLECPRVSRLQDHLSGLEVLSGKDLYSLMGNQPVFYLQERFAPDTRGFSWNGLLLFRTDDKEAARQLVREQAADLHIVMAFDSPLEGNYYILIATGTSRFDEKALKKNRFKYKALLEQHLSRVSWMPVDFFVRAFTEEHYDLVDKDFLFGKPEGTGEESPKPSESHCSQSRVSVVVSLKSLISQLFRRTA